MNTQLGTETSYPQEVLAISNLEGLSAKLNNRDRTFAEGLIKQFRKKESLSNKQWPWVTKLTDRANGTEKDDRPTRYGYEAIQDLFNAVPLARPRVAIRAGKSEIRLNRAKNTSNNPGFIYVTEDDNYVGKISPGGQFMPARNMEEAGNRVEFYLKVFMDDPAKTATAYGHQTGHCCFCGLLLTDPRSVTQGYGPICAGHYGLTWGQK